MRSARTRRARDRDVAVEQVVVVVAVNLERRLFLTDAQVHRRTGALRCALSGRERKSAQRSARRRVARARAQKFNGQQVAKVAARKADKADEDDDDDDEADDEEDFFGVGFA